MKARARGIHGTGGGTPLQMDHSMRGISMKGITSKLQPHPIPLQWSYVTVKVRVARMCGADLGSGLEQILSVDLRVRVRVRVKS